MGSGGGGGEHEPRDATRMIMRAKYLAYVYIHEALAKGVIRGVGTRNVR